MYTKIVSASLASLILDSFIPSAKFAGYIPGNVASAGKTQVFFSILEQSVASGDTVVAFSQSLFVLDGLENLLQQVSIPGKMIFLTPFLPLL
jgi:hypothetical protein